jgi:hypothetical protein
MGFLKNIFGRKDEQIKSYTDFWNWFQKHEKTFFHVVKNQTNIEKDFFDIMSPKLKELRDGYFFLTGMCDNNTAELILTADGNVNNIVFIEDLVEAAPIINGWKFTHLKPPIDISNVNIHMGEYKFNSENINFYANDMPDYPDEIDITVVHNDLTKNNKSEITNGTYIFLDNYLGELPFVTDIDNLTIIGKEDATKELIPIEKLKAFLSWRRTEFIEKYDGLRHDTENDNFSILEAELENGNFLLAVINTDLLQWDQKASHPWVAKFIFKYDGKNNNGMPSQAELELMNAVEDELMDKLKASDGYLNVGRQTAEGEREIYFACKDFRNPSKVFYNCQQQYSQKITITYDIYKDKYWQSFERFNRR